MAGFVELPKSSFILINTEASRKQLHGHKIPAENRRITQCSSNPAVHVMFEIQENLSQLLCEISLTVGSLIFACLHK